MNYYLIAALIGTTGFMTYRVVQVINLFRKNECQFCKGPCKYYHKGNE